MIIVVIVIIAIIFLYLMVMGIIGMSGGAVLSIKEFFFNTAWGIIALISGALSLIFFYVSSKMPKRIRESSSRVQAFTPILKNVSHNNSLINTNPMKEELQETVIDMSAMSLEGFFRDVAFTLNKPAPVIFKGWGNKRLRLDIERVQILGSYIQSVRGTCDDYLQLRADMVFAEKKFEHFLKVNAANVKNDLDLIEERYKDVKWHLEYNRRLKEADLNDRAVAVDERRAKIREQDARNEFFKEAIKNYSDMPDPLKAYMFTQVHGQYPEAKRDFEIEEKINDFIKKKYDIDLDNMKYDSKMKKEESQTFVEKMKHERNKKYDS